MRVVHPAVREVVNAILGSQSSIKCHGDSIAPDDIPVDQIKVDLLFTRVEDAMASLRAAVFCLEEKLVGKLNEGVVQCVAYLRRQMRVLIKEWCLRGGDTQALLSPESILPLSKLFSVGAGTDGATISFVRVTSGVLETCTDLGSVDHVMPEVSTDLLEFLPIDGTYNGGPIDLPEVPTPGFKALFQVLSLGPDVLSSVSPPLTSVTCRSAGDAVGASMRFTLTERLGSGGTSDVYSGRGVDGAPVVVKAPRYTTEDLLTQFEVEHECLSTLAPHDTVDARRGDEVPLVPQLLPGAMRLLVEGDVHPSRGISVPWPVLVFTEPINAVPLLRVLTGRKYRTLATRVELANVVARRLLQTAKLVHSQHWINCDVRPANIVLKGEVPVQVDWGLALPWLDKRNAAGCGTATFTADGFFNATTKAPHPIMDIASVAYTWLAIVHGNPYGEPPWNDEDSRTGWLSAKRRAKKRWLGVAEVDEFLRRVYSLAGVRSMPRLMGLYEWCVEDLAPSE